MALRQVDWSSRNRLSCSGCDDAPIILCLGPGLALPSGFDFINATIVAVVDLGGGILRYTVEYDDAQLIDPVTLLVENDILGAFCTTCMSDWVLALTSSSGVASIQGQDTVEDLVLGPIDITFAGTIILASLTTAPVVLTNTDALRSMNVRLESDAIVQSILEVGGVWTFDLERQVDGGAFVSVQSLILGAFGGTTGIPVIMREVSSVVFAPLESHSYVTRVSITTTVESLPFTSNANSGAAGFIGSGVLI